jgi:hypothetical protein
MRGSSMSLKPISAIDPDPSKTIMASSLHVCAGSAGETAVALSRTAVAAPSCRNGTTTCSFQAVRPRLTSITVCRRASHKYFSIRARAATRHCHGVLSSGRESHWPRLVRSALQVKPRLILGRTVLECDEDGGRNTTNVQLTYPARLIR